MISLRLGIPRHMSLLDHRPGTSPSFPPVNPLGLLRDGYIFWPQQRERRGDDVVQARLLHERVTVVCGAEGAQAFYETPQLERSSALPTALVGPLFGDGPVHMLDGSAHRHRKALFTSLLTAEAVDRTRRSVGEHWDDEVARAGATVDVFEVASRALLRAGCEWVGLPDPGAATSRVARDMLAMVDGFGGPGARQLRARLARRRTDAWVEERVRAVRSEPSPIASPLTTVALHRDEHGELLPAHTAAVEVINLVRPLVAVSWLVSGLVLAFDTFPGLAEEVAAGDVTPMEMAQETRRFHPFVPFLAARATDDIEVLGAVVPRGTLLVLDIWGTNHDLRTWHSPDMFDPRRFRSTPVTPYNLVPQGGGDRTTGHRCPGEDLTLMTLAELAPRIARLSPTVVGRRPDLHRMPPRPTLTARIRSPR